MSEFLAWKRSEDEFFGQPDGTCEHFRRPWPADAPVDLVETSYFGFYIPEDQINGEIYHLFHPVLGVASGGMFIFKGKNSHPIQAEHFVWRNYMRMPQDLTDCTYENGISVKMRKPLTEFDLAYESKERGVALQLNTRAIMPAAFRPGGGHFTQAMKNTGTLRLGGREYAIDGFFTRDRSWGDPRSEEQRDIAPVGWHVGVFDESFAFHVIAFDSPELCPQIAKRYPQLQAGKNCLWGYVWKDGTLRGIRSCQKQTRRLPNGGAPTSIELSILDDRDEVHEVQGTVQSSYPFSPWQTILAFVGMTRWTCKGLTGYGDTQDSVYGDFFREHSR